MAEDTVRAAGAVLWRESGQDGVRVAVVHRPRHGDWSLPKGKLDPGETAPFAAVREIAEETGFTAVLGRRLGTVSYTLPGDRPKRVDYWAALATDGGFAANEEVDDIRWLPVTAATELVDYDGDREMLREFAAATAGTAAVLLVRHADAGTRVASPAEDDLRPLSGRGVAQAERLRELLPLFGACAVHAAPIARCAQTVAGVATDLEVPVTDEPALSESGYWQDSGTGTRRLLEIAAEAKPGAAIVVSSQGGAIPHLLDTLAATAGLPLPDATSAKGGLWVLSFAGAAGTQRLLAADYYENPA